jgi:hypothetical protein
MGGTKAFAILIALVAGLGLIFFHYDLFTTRYGLAFGIATLMVVGGFVLYAISFGWGTRPMDQ